MNRVKSTKDLYLKLGEQNMAESLNTKSGDISPLRMPGFSSTVNRLSMREELNKIRVFDQKTPERSYLLSNPAVVSPNESENKY
jgi:hypothetical protein